MVSAPEETAKAELYALRTLLHCMKRSGRVAAGTSVNDAVSLNVGGSTGIDGIMIVIRGGAPVAKLFVAPD